LFGGYPLGGGRPGLGGLFSNEAVGKRRTRMKSKLLVGLALVVAAVMPLAGCAGGKGRIHISKLCKGAGGTWNAQAETCDGAAPNVRAAASMCQAHGGVYEKSTGNCEGIGLD
jgi:hypothetical protein